MIRNEFTFEELGVWVIEHHPKNDGNFASCTTRNDVVFRVFFFFFFFFFFFYNKKKKKKKININKLIY
jgi:hypothetical protein